MSQNEILKNGNEELRSRDISRWFPSHTMDSLDEFKKSSVVDGLYSVPFGDEDVDFLIRNRQAESTIVFFHAAVDSNATIPQLSGETISRQLGVNLISFSDPAIAKSNRVKTGWHIGTKEIENFPLIAREIISHSIEYLHSKRLIFIGSSAGGYAAVNIGKEFGDRDGTIVLALNPRLNLSERPWPDLSTYIKSCFDVDSWKDQVTVRKSRMIMKLSDCLTHEILPEIAILQNSNDRVFYKHQFSPFVDALQGNSNVWSRVEPYQSGHKPVPRAVLLQILLNLTNTRLSTEQALYQSAFRSLGKDSRGRSLGFILRKRLETISKRFKLKRNRRNMRGMVFRKRGAV